MFGLRVRKNREPCGRLCFTELLTFSVLTDEVRWDGGNRQIDTFTYFPPNVGFVMRAEGSIRYTSPYALR